MQLYIVNYESAYQYHKFLFLFGVLFICRNGLWCAYDMQWLGLGVWVFFGWWRLRGWLKGIKRTSSSAPPTEKHDILHSQIKKSIVVFRHDFLLVLIVSLRRFLWSYFMRNVQSALYSLCEMRERKSLCSQVNSFPLTENGRAFYRSDITWVRSKIIFSPEFNKRNLECGHPLAETYIGAYAS